MLQSKFIAKEKLIFPLLADPEAKVARAYYVFNPKNNLAKRVTFVITKDGNIAKIFNVTKAGDHPGEVLEYVQKNIAKK